MSVPFDFMKTMFVNGVGLAVWISLLLAANMVVPLVFITTVEAQFVLAAAIARAVTQTAIFASKGFVRLMGIGHIYWVPLLPWLCVKGGAKVDHRGGGKLDHPAVEWRG